MEHTRKTAKVSLGLGLTALLLAVVPLVLMAIGKTFARPVEGRFHNAFTDLAFNSAFAVCAANLLLFSPLVVIVTIITVAVVARSRGAESGTARALWGMASMLVADIVSWLTMAGWLGM